MKKMCLLTKKCQANLTIELDELCGNLDNDLHYLLADPSHCVTHHLEDGASPNHFGGFYILECNITSQDTACTDDCPEIRSGRDNHLFKQICCSSSTSNLPLAKKFSCSPWPSGWIQTHPSSLDSRCANHMGAFQRTSQGDQTVGNGGWKSSQLCYHMWPYRS